MEELRDGAFAHFLHILNILCILPCLFMKLPQVILILRTKETAGLSLVAVLLDLYLCTIPGIYHYINGYALKTYVEYSFLIVQQCLLLYIYLENKKQLNIRSCGLSALISVDFQFSLMYTFRATIFLRYRQRYCILVVFLSTKYCPSVIMTLLVAASYPVGFFCKVVHMKTLYDIKDSSSVSLTTWIISAATNAGRIVTVAFDFADSLVIFGYCMHGILSSIMCLMIIHFIPEKKKTE